ncbi:MAG: response regulator transcription factor [Oscillospiraceae bacterium]|jgi:DNA-binding response OmpR family regulator|nr:response regulator transcription factor [Oscillospiraceae bacterium]
MRILVAEDERDLNDVLVKKLKKEGYAVDACYDGEEALAFLQAAPYDAAVLDIMMPRMSGLEVLAALRAGGSATPVLFLTARDAIEDRVQGLDAGANDYLVKPFSLEELCARIRAMTRKAAGQATNTLSLADLTLDMAAHTAHRGGVEIALSAREFAVLSFLLQNRGRVLSREQIEAHVWNYDYEGGSNLVDVYIRNLRRKVDDGFEPRLIHTVRGSGYVMREAI